MTQDEVIKLIQESGLSDEATALWTARIREEGLTSTFLEDLRAAFQVEIDDGAKQLGIDIETLPEYKEREAAMVKEVQDASNALEENIGTLNKQARKLQEDAGKSFDTLKAQAIKDQIA